MRALYDFVFKIINLHLLENSTLGTFTKEKSSMWNLTTCANGALVISPS